MVTRDWTGTKDWTDPVEKTPVYTEKEKELLAKAKPFVVRNYGNLDVPTLEAMIIGNLVADPDGDGEKDAFNRINNLGVQKEAASPVCSFGFTSPLDKRNLLISRSSKSMFSESS